MEINKLELLIKYLDLYDFTHKWTFVHSIIFYVVIMLVVFMISAVYI